MSIVILVIIFAINFSFYVYATNESDSSIREPIYQLANVVRFFNTTELCDRNSNASTYVDDFGSLNICFTTKIKEGDNSGV